MEIFNEYESLISEQIMKLATIFLKDAGEFYPFAMGIDESKLICSIAASNGDEFPGSSTLIDILENNLPLDIIEGTYLLAAICIDIFIHENIEGINVKKNAIEIRFIGNKYRRKKYYCYELESNGDVVFSLE